MTGGLFSHSDCPNASKKLKKKIKKLGKGWKKNYFWSWREM